MKYATVFFLLFIYCTRIYGQASERIFRDGFCNKIITTADGGLLMLGEMETNSNENSFLMKFDSTSSVSWLKVFRDQLEFYSYGNDVVQLPGNNYLLTGMMFHDTISNEEISLIKCDSMGNLMWAKRYGNLQQNDQAKSILVLNDGYLLAGYTTGLGFGGENYFIMKVDTFGNQLWSKAYGTNNDERGLFLRAYPGGFVFGGYAEAAGGTTDIFLAYLDSSANLISTKQIEIAGNQKLTDLHVNADGSMLLLGTSYTGTNPPQAIIISISAAGAIDWCRLLTGTLGIPNAIREYLGDFIVGGHVMVWTYSENAALIRINTSGDIVSQDYFGDSTGTTIKSFAVRGDSLFAAGYIYRPGATVPSIYFNRYLPGDSACNHYQVNNTLQPLTATIGNPVWQVNGFSFTITSPQVVVTDILTRDSIMCDFNPMTPEIDFDRDVSVIPNPACELLYISFPDRYSHYDLRLYDITGKMIDQYFTEEHSMTISLANIPDGIYFLHVNSKTIKGGKRIIKTGNRN